MARSCIFACRWGAAMRPDPIKVMVVDDHAVALAGVRLLLQDASDIRIVAAAQNVEQALGALDRETIDVALLDISLGADCGLSLLPLLRRKQPAVAVLMLSAHAETYYAVRALRAGAAGYLTKDVGAAELADAVRKAVSGVVCLSSSLRERLARPLHGHAQSAHFALSGREFDVMRRLAAGESLTSIGRALYLSPKTVSTHRSRILVKLCVGSNAELARYALEEGLI